MNQFEDEAQRIIDTAARQVELRVLIWGPGDPGEGGSPEAKDGYEKRCLIRKELREKFPQSQFEFSEDIHIRRIIGSVRREAVHAASAHLVIILDINCGARGVHLEIDHFTQYPWFRSKVWLLIPKEYLDTKGLVADVYKLIPDDQIQGYTPDQFKLCHVAKEMSVGIVETVATEKYLNHF
jgi:hypothetical protein